MNVDEYGRMYAVEDRHWWYRGLRALVWQTWNAVPGKPDGPLLDIGCGTGGTLIKWGQPPISRPLEIGGCPHLSHLSPAFAAFGMDHSAEALRFCRERGQRGLCRGDASALPYRDASFAGALMLDVLYHRAVADPAAALREARRVLKPGGVLIVNVPAYDWLRSSHDTAIHTARRFTRPQLRALLESAGLRVERITYWNTLLFPAAAAVRLVRKSASRDTSDLAHFRPTPATSLLDAALTIERATLRVTGLPFGLSVLAVARAA
jgi:SAM-dependent methyltransferase